VCTMDTSSRSSRTSGVSRLQRQESASGTSYTAAMEFFRRKVPLFSLIGLFETSVESDWTVILGLLIYAVQQLAWTINTRYSYVWGYILGSDVSRVLYSFHIAIWDSTLNPGANATVTHGLLWTAVAVGVVTVTLLAFLRFFIDTSERQSSALIIPIRCLYRSLSSWLLIPVAHVLIGPLVCDSDNHLWFYGGTNRYGTQVPNLQCWSGEHIPLFIFALLTSFVLGAVTYYTLLCDFFDGPLNPHLKARAHTLCDRLYFYHAIGSVLLYHVLMAYHQPELFALLHGLSSAFFAVAVTLVLPYYRSELNVTIATVHIVDAFVSFVCAGCGFAGVVPSSGSNLSSVIALGALPAVIALSICVVDSRVAERFRRELRRCAIRMPSAQNTNLADLPYPTGLNVDTWAQLKEVTAVILLADNQLENEEQQGKGAQSLKNRKGVAELLVPYLDHVAGVTDVEVASRFVLQFSRHYNVVPTLSMVAFAAKIFVRGTVTFPESVLLRTQFADFLWQFHPGLSQTALHEIEKVEDKDTALETRYFTERISQRLRFSMGTRTKNSSLGFKLAEGHHVRTLSNISAFWVKLTETNVDLRELGDIADKVTRSRTDAVAAFRRTLQNQTSNDLNLINRLGAFLEDILMDTEGANQCRSEAKDIQESRSSRHVRGAKKSTSTEVDPSTLSSRLLQLLSGDSTKSTNRLGSRSRGARVLAVQIAAISFILLILIAIALGLTSVGVDSAKAGTDKLIYGGILRYTPEEFVGTLYEWERSKAIGNNTAVDLMYGMLQDELSRYDQAISQVSLGKAKITNQRHRQFFEEKTCLFTDLDGTVSLVSPWQLTSTFRSWMANILVKNVSQTSASYLLKLNLKMYGTSFESFVDLYIESVSADFQLQSTQNLILFGIAFLAAVALYATILLNFQRTAQGRIFAFQLFTLIPFDDLQTLASDARRKANAIQKERDDQSGILGASGTVGPNDGKEKAGTSTASGDELKKSISQSTVSFFQEDLRRLSQAPTQQLPKWMVAVGVNIAAIVVKSCIKAGREKSNKKVTVTNQVEAFSEARDEDADGAKGLATAVEDDLVEEIEDTPVTKRAAQKTETPFYIPLGFSVLLLSIIGLSAAACGLAFTRESAADLQEHPIEGRWSAVAKVESNANDLMFNSLAVAFSGSAIDAGRLLKTLQNETTRIELSAFAVGNTTAANRLRPMVQHLTTLQRSILDLLESAIQVPGLVSATSTALIRSNALARPYTSILQEIRPALSASVNASEPTEVAAWALTYLCLNRIASIWVDIAAESETLRNEAVDEVLSTAKKIDFAPLHGVVAVVLILCCLSLVILVRFRAALAKNFGSATVCTLLIVGSLAVILIGLLSSWESQSNIFRDKDINRFSASVDQAEVNLILKRMVIQQRLYVTTMQSQYWREAELNFKMLIETSLPESNLYSGTELDDMVSSLTTTKNFFKVSSALTMSLINDTAAIEVEMAEAFQTTWWDLQREPDYELEKERFQFTDPSVADGLYTNTTFDLARTAVEKRRIIISTMFSERYLAWKSQLVSALSVVTSKPVQFAIDDVAGFMPSVDSISAASGAVSVLLLIASAVLIFVIATPLAQFLGLQNEASATQSSPASGQVRHSKLLDRARVVLTVITLVVLACFIMGIVAPLTSLPRFRNLNSMSSLAATVAASYVAAEEMRVLKLNPNSVFRDTVSEALNARVDLSNALAQVFYGTSKEDGNLQTLGEDPLFDALVWGGVDGLRWDNLGRSYVRRLCTTSRPTATDAAAVQGQDVPVSILQGVQTRRQLLLELTQSDVSGIDISVEQAQLSKVLRQSIDAYADYALQSHVTLMTQFQIVIGLLIVTLLVGCIAVFFPVVAVLVEDDAATWHLIAMIPYHVRESVPAIADFIETGRADSAAELQRKIEQSENLLRNILPAKIANRLKSGEQPIADMHRSVTMCFTDLVGFTATSHNMNAVEIVSFLNELFVEFDTIAELFEVEKIKTIGDAYFMVGGLEARITDHGLRVIEAALAFFDSMGEHNERHPERKPLRMRLGVHTGPAVAGVIGTKKVAYDLWGRSVEIANAMESTGIPMKVHISETTLREVSSFFQYVARGPLPNEKGVPEGMPDTYIITGRAAPSPYQHRRRPRMNKPLAPPPPAHAGGPLPTSH
jgi:class 3 adenylate cyclase